MTDFCSGTLLRVTDLLPGKLDLMLVPPLSDYVTFHAGDILFVLTTNCNELGSTYVQHLSKKGTFWTKAFQLQLNTERIT